MKAEYWEVSRMPCMSRGLKLKKYKPLKLKKRARPKWGILHRFRRKGSLDTWCLLMSFLYLSCNEGGFRTLLDRVETEPVGKGFSVGSIHDNLGKHVLLVLLKNLIRC